jgi:serine/threonine-protein phosphatase 2B catalytic subunit
MFETLLSKATKEQLAVKVDEEDVKKKLCKGDKENGHEPKKVEVLRSKIKALGRMSRIFKNLRTESELLLKIKDLAPDGKIPRGLLLKGRPAIKDSKVYI